MSIERLAASGQNTDFLAPRWSVQRMSALPFPPLSGFRSRLAALHPQALSALFAPAAMAVGAVGLACLWSALPRPAPITNSAWETRTPTGAFLRLRPAAGPVAEAALRQSAAMAQILVDLGAVQVTPPAPAALPQGPGASLQRLHDAETDMIAAADRGARAQLDGEKRLFRTAGLDARPYAADPYAAGNAGATLSPLELRDARVLAAKLDTDAPLARQLQGAARDLITARGLAAAAEAMPLAYPVDDPRVSSPFGVRIDPFRGQVSFHPGMDFPGRYGQGIHVTAPGVVSFAGQRSGYGNCIEVDHGHGFKTRYGHLSGFVARVGDRVQTGQTVALMGSTGRSTGVHVHYEVWANGRLQNPAGFLKAGATQG